MGALMLPGDRAWTRWTSWKLAVVLGMLTGVPLLVCMPTLDAKKLLSIRYRGCRLLSSAGDDDVSAAYEAGKKARLTGGQQSNNPYHGAVIRGIVRYTDEQSGSDWTRGFRDQNDALSKQFPAISSFRRKSNRYYRA
jgi:hypothetical protein